jgi:hypothetical protein
MQSTEELKFSSRVKKVDFLIRTYAVNFVERLLSDDEERRLYGNIDYTNGVINLDPNHVLDDMKLTFLHEVCHAILNIFLIEKSLSDEDNEKVVDAMSSGFMLFIKQNPDTIKFLMEESGENKNG